jgi:pyruvate/2-oxoglutarate dehydrogenase complex dihydrolipoamide acyltransferase (E2) component
MRVAVVMPKLGFEMESGQVHEWSKQVGEEVTAGETIATIETEKTTMDLEAPAAGRLVEIVHASGDEVPVDDPIGYIETDT